MELVKKFQMALVKKFQNLTSLNSFIEKELDLKSQNINDATLFMVVVVSCLPEKVNLTIEVKKIDAVFPTDIYVKKFLLDGNEWIDVMYNESNKKIIDYKIH